MARVLPDNVPSVSTLWRYYYAGVHCSDISPMPTECGSRGWFNWNGYSPVTHVNTVAHHLAAYGRDLRDKADATRAEKMRAHRWPQCRLEPTDPSSGATNQWSASTMARPSEWRG